MSSSPNSSGSSSRRPGSFETDDTSSFETYYSDMSTVSSTPHKRGVAGIEIHTLPFVEPRLKEDLHAKYSCNVPLLDFVMHVWGIDQKAAQHILSDSQNWELRPQSLADYTAAKPERLMYAPFAEIADSLVQDARSVVAEFFTQQGRDDLAAQAAADMIYFWNELGDEILESPLTKRKPDMLAVDKEVVQMTPTWSLARQVIEFKPGSHIEKESYATPSISARGSSAAGSSSSLRFRQVSSSTSASGTKRRKPSKAKGAAPKRAPRLKAASTPATPSASTPSSTSSALPAVQSSSAAGSSSSLPFSGGSSASGTKSRPTPKAKPAAPQRATRSKAASTPATPSASNERYSALDAPSPASSLKRKHGGTSDGKDSKRLRKVPKVREITMDEIQLATYALECLNASTRHYASGVFIDRFQVSLWYYDRSCVISTVTFDFRQEPGLLALVLYAISACDNKHAGFDPYLITPPSMDRPEPVEENKHWQDVVGSEIHLPSSKKYPGRGKFRIEDTLFAYRGLVGRGTMVYKVAPIVGRKCGSEALKLGWPLIARPLEVETIERLHSKLPPRWREHIPEVTFSATLTAKQLELPRVELLKVSPIDNFEDRQMHALSMKLYSKLWEVGSAEAFQSIFVDCVECHYHAYVEGRVLHRDLSENNLMFKVDKDRTVKGILNDWDMASHVEANDEIKLSTATHRTGTIPFMARELLTDENIPAHLYRHDLESFFYILIWAALHYEFPAKKKHPKIMKVQPWDSLSFDIAREFKQAFISSKKSKEPLFAHVRPECKALLPWLNSLWTLFRDSDMADESTPGWDNATLGGLLTFETFMQALGRTPR
ncbi:hypothetical protein FPV67DRAFT_1474320 [Lyophyllum atratum]|nr:hypothetical protein FPV67DRAFT_1474320 [Lyophyllum atratum]